MKTLLSRFGWLIVLVASLGTSAWSLFFVATHEGAPPEIAAVVSACFDGVALICADYALRYARIGDSGLAPRMTVFIFAGLSAYVNSQHAVILHEPEFVRILWGVPSVGSILVYEFHVRWERRTALARANRIAAPLPVYGIWTWLRYPRKTLRRISSVIDYRADLITKRNMPAPKTRSGGTSQETVSENEETPDEFLKLVPDPIELNPAEIRLWAKSRGFAVNSRGPIPDDLIERYRTEMEGIA